MVQAIKKNLEIQTQSTDGLSEMAILKDDLQSSVLIVMPQIITMGNAHTSRPMDRGKNNGV